jgi:pimeloyl-ACP methyl ester carboxylesterase
MRKFLMAVSLVILSALSALGAQASRDDQAGFVRISSDRELYVRWTHAKDNKPTVVLINGLTYSTKQWDDFAEALTNKGIGVLRYDPQGMGETLLKYAPILENISYETQVDDLKALIKVLKITEKLNIIGLSYGGGIGIAFSAKYPEMVKNMIAMAPYTEPVASQEQWIQSQIWLTRQTVPWNTATDAELHEFFFRQLVYMTYPMVEPVVLENPFKLEATFRMALGIRGLKALDVVGKMPVHSLHLIIAGSDQYISREVLESFWSKTPAFVKASKSIINNVEHKIPEAAPHFAAEYVEQILKENGLLSGGREFEADPVSGKVKYDGGSFDLPKGY